ncbi:MAG: hypothetical protein JWN03_650 [Nocardia sp.]|uniref:hypothetical protein n=1 Tax=Nocardia sp. TaxID=1821 RepID=UPI00262A24B1|nr:hypothetical protein [Nocardia sp.]MCU1640375.1 hypothetical protein [Nocardia sp.]
MELSAGLTRMAGRLRTAVVDAGGALRTVVSELPNDMRTVADNIVTAESDIVPRFNPSETPHFIGMNAATGMPHMFTSEQIRSQPISDFDGNVIGVNFPLKVSDSKKPIWISHEGLESIYTEYYQAERTRSLWPPKGLLTRKPKWTFGRSWRPAPWATDKSENLVFARAHAAKRGYFIQVKKKIPLTKWSMWTPTQVDGKTYGKILASNDHFKQAVKTKSTARLIQMSCSPAGRSAARKSAESLHSSGLGFDVHATENTHFSRFESRSGSLAKQYGNVILGHGSEMKFDDAGSPAKSPWAEYKAPRKNTDTADSGPE